MDNLIFNKLFLLIAMINPLACSVIFASFLGNLNTKRKILITIRELCFSACMIGLIIALNKMFLTMIGVSIDGIRLSGSILLLLAGLDILNKNDEEKSENKEVSMLYPLAFPIIIGPAFISTTLQSCDELGQLLTFSLVAIAFFITSLVILFYLFLNGHLSKVAKIVLTKIGGILIMMIGGELLIISLRNIFA